MATPSTPPRRSTRAKTPPAPRHGPMEDDYEPYSPRRSKRSTLVDNPYSSFNSDRSSDQKIDSAHERTPGRQRGGLTTPPPTTARKRARFAESIAQLSSPPSSPIGPSTRFKTPLRNKSARNVASPATHDTPSTGSRFRAQIRSAVNATSSAVEFSDPALSLLSPAKTPTQRMSARGSKKRTFSSFLQPPSPSSVMPPSRKMQRLLSPEDVELDITTTTIHAEADFELHTDYQSRLPELDTSEDNPFIADTSSSLKAKDSLVEKGHHFDKGVVYMKRGKKIFRPFEGPDAEKIRFPGFERGPPIPNNSKIRPKAINFDNDVTMEQQDDDQVAIRCDDPAGPSTPSKKQFSTSMMNVETSDSEASTIADVEDSPTLGAARNRRGKKAIFKNKQHRKNGIVSSVPLEDPF